jgi:hypothetical protein
MDRYEDADRRLAGLLKVAPAHEIQVHESVVSWPDLEWGGCFTGRWTQCDISAFHLQTQYRVSVNYYDDKVTANVPNTPGVACRFSAYKSDEEATRYAIVMAVIKFLELKDSRK